MAHRLLSSEYLHHIFYLYRFYTLRTDNAVTQFQFRAQTSHVLLL